MAVVVLVSMCHQCSVRIGLVVRLVIAEKSSVYLLSGLVLLQLRLAILNNKGFFVANEPVFCLCQEITHIL